VNPWWQGFSQCGAGTRIETGISRLLNLLYAYMTAGAYFFKNPDPPLTWDFFETYYLPPFHYRQILSIKYM